MEQLDLATLDPAQIRWVSASVLGVSARLDSLGVPATADQTDTRRALEMTYPDLWRYGPPRWLVEQTVTHRRPPAPPRQLDTSRWATCVLCRTPMNPAGLRGPRDVTHPACDLPPFACDCETPWDGAARPGGVHCVYCHHNLATEVFEAHKPYGPDGCTSPANMPDVDGAQRFALYREGRFKVWRRIPRVSAPVASSRYPGGQRSA